MLQIDVLEWPILCELFPVIFLASQYLSTLLVLGFSVERYIAICHPFTRDTYCTTSRAGKVISGLALGSLLINGIQSYFWSYKHDVGVCSLRDEVQAGGIASFWSVWSLITEMIVFAVVPFVILCLNVLVIVETRRMSANEMNRLRRSGGGSTRTGAPSATTFTLLAVSFYLIASTLPVTICYVLYLSFPEGSQSVTDVEVWTDPVWQAYFTYWQIRIVVQELCMSHFALNFYIYLITGKIFRRELIRLRSKISSCYSSTTATFARNRTANGNELTYLRTIDHNGNGTVRSVL